MRLRTLFLLIGLSTAGAWAQTSSVETLRQYISGTGSDDAVEWKFMCTDGRRSGQWTTIGVPSCWELQGFGTYQYGMRFYGKATPQGIADEKGLYKTEFALPQEWQGRQIELVFEAVFTDANVTINGRKAGKGLYQGGFTRHTIDVSDRVYFGTKRKNVLEVEVAKESANPQVNLAERRADYWNFGGIWRPVFIVSKPMRNISRVAIDAGMDGRFRADVFLSRSLASSEVGVEIADARGKVVAKSKGFPVASDQASVDFSVASPQLWTAETPHLYTAVFTLRDQQGKVLHVERQRFGFRTIEYRHQYAGDQEDGVFINGRKVIFKGVNRHSFRPETGRTLSKAKNIEDVLLIKSMNMNAVRLSHYPADPEFLDACDSLGLYVECEQPGWHWGHETITGSMIVEEMITRDVNHPSIIFWSNGNEGGFNYELEPLFHKFDPQRRVVLYPWANRNGFETKHYRSWGETADYMRQKEIFMPTEFLHGLYDGGHGAGLSDYWTLMMSNPRCAGGFLWDLMDQGVLRTDQDGIIDCVGNFGADGIVGPHMEREGSFYTIKEVWSPVKISCSDDQPGELTVTNLYDFTDLSECKFSYQYLRMPAYGQSDASVLSKGTIAAPKVAPQNGGQSNVGRIAVPKGQGDVLLVSVTDPTGREVYTWSKRLDKATASHTGTPRATPQVSEDAETCTVVAAGRTYTFSKHDGRLLSVAVGTRTIAFGGGPRFVAAKRSDRSQDGFYNHDDNAAFQKKTLYTEYADQGQFCGFSLDEGTLSATYRHGSLTDVRWRFLDDGSLDMQATATFNGVVDLMGLAFDYPEQKVKSKQWVGDGPYRVWQNRLEGPQYGYWHNDYNDPIPAESWDYPEFKGYFANVKWMQLNTTEGSIGIEPQPCVSAQNGEGSCYVGVYTPRDGRDNQLYSLPPTGIALLAAIPAVRNKVNTTDLNGPSAQPFWAKGQFTFNATLRFE